MWRGQKLHTSVLIQCQTSCWWNMIITVNTRRPLTRRFVCGINLFLFLRPIIWIIIIESVCQGLSVRSAWKSWFWMALTYIQTFLQFATHFELFYICHELKRTYLYGHFSARPYASHCLYLYRSVVPIID